VPRRAQLRRSAAHSCGVFPRDIPRYDNFMIVCVPLLTAGYITPPA
jgi:hypothetical protein